MSSPSPTDEELLAAVRALYSVSSPPGIKKIISSIKASHPDWEPHINSKTVRAAVRKCEENKTAEGKREITAGASGRKPSSLRDSQDDEAKEMDMVSKAMEVTASRAKRLSPQDSEDDESTRMLLRHAQTLRDWMATHPWPRTAKIDALYSPLLLGPRIMSLIMLPTDAASPPEDLPPDSAERKVYLAFHIFYLEWDCFMGWDPAEVPPPVEPIVPDYEPLAFPTLFPYGRGHYLGPEQQNGLTFEEYALHCLHLADGRFRGSARWLMWAVSRTADAELAKAINCVLVTLHKQKARHMGKGSVQVLAVEQPFERLIVDGV
ncbi:MYND-type domain-containing protein [Mycena venus]|uniref:MYND-type domain-containing protein n=1 Tax=Mycena venus TaxID=2733690 RepID=A0A8H6YBD0_9AGAR|nr:MYND-type domain-containing protein [Mycena venus]